MNFEFFIFVGEPKYNFTIKNLMIWTVESKMQLETPDLKMYNNVIVQSQYSKNVWFWAIMKTRKEIHLTIILVTCSFEW